MQWADQCFGPYDSARAGFIPRSLCPRRSEWSRGTNRASGRLAALLICRDRDWARLRFCAEPTRSALDPPRAKLAFRHPFSGIEGRSGLSLALGIGYSRPAAVRFAFLAGSRRRKMTSNASRSCNRFIKGSSAVALLLGAALVCFTEPVHASTFQISDIVTDDQANLAALGFPAAVTEDRNLVNPWGVSFRADEPVSGFPITEWGCRRFIALPACRYRLHLPCRLPRRTSRLPALHRRRRVR